MDCGHRMNWKEFSTPAFMHHKYLALNVPKTREARIKRYLNKC